MGMFPLHAMFPEIAVPETRTVTIPPGEALPADSYALVELFCVERGCDCRRVMLHVVAERGTRHLATINHAFDPENADDILGQTFLDPLHRQSPLAPLLLELFLDVVCADKAYLARLERHYQLVKDALQDPTHPVHAKIPPGEEDGLPPVTWPRQQVRARPKLGRNEPCPCGSGKKLKSCGCGRSGR